MAKEVKPENKKSKTTYQLADFLATSEELLSGVKPWENDILSGGDKIIIRRHCVDLLRIEGINPYLISIKLGIPHTTVRNDCAAIDKSTEVDKLEDVRNQRRAELYRRFLRVFEKAEKHREKALDSFTTTETEDEDGFDAKGPTNNHKVTVKEHLPQLAIANDALKVQLEAAREIARIYGLAVERKEVTGENGGPVKALLLGWDSSDESEANGENEGEGSEKV